MLDLCESWLHPAPQAACRPIRKELRVVQLRRWIISQLWFLLNSGWSRARTAWAGSNQLFTCQTNRSHHVTKVQRRRIKPLYEVFKKKWVLLYTTTQKKQFIGGRGEKILCTVNNIRDHMVVQIVPMQVHVPVLDPSVNSDQWLYEGHTHTHTYFYSCYFTTSSYPPLSVGHCLMFEINTKDNSAMLPPCVLRRVWWKAAVSMSRVCVCVCQPNGQNPEPALSLCWMGRDAARPVSLQSWAAFQQQIWNAVARLCKPKGSGHSHLICRTETCALLTAASDCLKWIMKHLEPMTP